MTEEHLERRLRNIAHEYPYPDTPDIVAALRRESQSKMVVRRHRGRLVAPVLIAGLVVCLLALLAYPQTRNTLYSWFGVGAIGVKPVRERPSLDVETALESYSLQDLGDELEVAEAEARFERALLFPTWPPDLPETAAVYWQEPFGQFGAVSFLWLGSGDRETFLLTHISVPYFGYKMVEGDQIVETTVGENSAIWIEGPHVLSLNAVVGREQRVVDNNVLLWSDGILTYRLEGQFDLAEARRIAESMR